MSIDNLPLEIIQHIFSLCCRNVWIKIPSCIHYLTTQEIISLVCSKWRAIALSTRELWNSVAMEFETCLNVDLDHGLEIVQTWLNRAGTLSISLTIYFNEALKESDIRKIRQSLLSYQIRDLELESTGTVLIPIDTSCHLKTLSLEYDRGSRNRVEFPHLGSLPSLKVLRLSLNLNDFTDHRNLYAIPWHQLSVLESSYPFWPSQICLHILRQCQSLIQCTFWMSGAQAQMQSEIEDDIILPNLEILCLHFDGRGWVDHILRPLILPNIKVVHLTSDSLANGLNQTLIELMARRSGFKHLVTFAMPNIGNPVRALGLLLRCMPALRSIEIADGQVIFDERTLHNLSLGIIGPYLEEMKFKAPSEFEIDLLLKAIRERHVYAMAPGLSQIKPFKSVVLLCYDYRVRRSLRKEAERCSEETKTKIVLVM